MTFRESSRDRYRIGQAQYLHRKLGLALEGLNSIITDREAAQRKRHHGDLVLPVRPMRELVDLIIAEVVSRCSGNLSRAAKRLGLSRGKVSTVMKKLRGGGPCPR